MLSGTGEVRIGAERLTIRAGDVIACPPGGPEAAHQIVNTHSSEPLRYLAVSTKEQPELVEYPSTGRFGILAAVTNEKGEPGQFRFIGRGADSLPYWEGE